MGNTPDIQKMNECPDCASQNIVHSAMREQVICRDCGLVFEPFTPVEKPVAARAPPAKKAKVKPKKAKKPAKKAKPKKAKARVKPAKKAKPKKVKAKAKPAKKKKKFGWW